MSNRGNSSSIYRQIRIDGQKVKLNLDFGGYMIDPASWTENHAKAIARIQNTELEAMHWKVIKAVRDYIARTKAMPDARTICDLVIIEMDDLKALFPGGLESIYKIAGMPNPNQE